MVPLVEYGRISLVRSELRIRSILPQLPTMGYFCLETEPKAPFPESEGTLIFRPKNKNADRPE